MLLLSIMTGYCPVLYVLTNVTSNDIMMNNHLAIDISSTVTFYH